MSKLKEKRIAAELTQKELAERAGLNLRTLQEYEQGKKIFDHARLDTMLSVCLILNCKLSEVVENQDFLKMLKAYGEK